MRQALIIACSLLCAAPAVADDRFPVFPPIPHDRTLYLRTMYMSGSIFTGKRACPKELRSAIKKDLNKIVSRGVFVVVDGDKMWAAVGVDDEQLFNLDKDKHVAHRIVKGEEDSIIGYWDSGQTSLVHSRSVEIKVYRMWVGKQRDLVRIDVSVIVQPKAGDDTCFEFWEGTSFPVKK